MYFRVLKNAVGESDVFSASRVVKAEAVEALFEAIDLRKRLVADLERARVDRLAAIEDARRDGYAQGKREAFQTMAERLQNAHGFLDRAHATFEAQFASFVRLAVTRLVGQLSDGARVQAVIQHARAEFEEAHALSVVVHPDDAAAARDAMERWPSSGRSVLVEDASIGRGDCRLESPFAVVEYEWRALFEGIERAALEAWRDAEPLEKEKG
ncbi:hrpE/YscL/FliH and V-type ATPase subunit E family protein [Burkholderia thailandensis MSMB121]|uniref:FliH/SctL family protein n=1 Tax=Burkholderia humptydooensis TaxID=430531 RepID=UPI000327F516|nr:FliH/SctL family protein [Burkholderia humptydooensis]AGK49741.1 hrpE/YscL/FliH and V-type ATPase subunit E family protein [Burkholderia thailandensis MSMB121]ATF32279.1 ATPase V [Burkholderia thailandensis]KST72345.1 ATPase V [Burkholderia humptydooensis]